MGSKILSSADESVALNGLLSFLETRDDRHVYRLYARATSGSIAEQTTDGLFEATVSQLLSVDITNIRRYPLDLDRHTYVARDVLIMKASIANLFVVSIVSHNVDFCPSLSWKFGRHLKGVSNGH